MKYKDTTQPKQFSPVDITFTFESQKEIDVFYALFNYTPVCDFLEREADNRMPSQFRASVDPHCSNDRHELWGKLVKLWG